MPGIQTRFQTQQKFCHRSQIPMIRLTFLSVRLCSRNAIQLITITAIDFLAY